MTRDSPFLKKKKSRFTNKFLVVEIFKTEKLRIQLPIRVHMITY